MKIIALMNEKGGTGKSTAASNLATALHRRGKRVVLVDADPQGTARDWRAASPEGIDLPDVIALDRPQMLGAIHALSADYVIVDTPAKAESMAAAVVRVAHVALVVIQPSGADIWASAATVKLIRSKLDVGGQVDAAFLVNRVKAGTKLAGLVKGGEWNEYGLDQLTSTLGDRTAYAQALTDGVSVYDLPNLDARADVDAVLAELEAARWL
ncbi:MAG: cobyrinic acid ac-diamide synthase [Polaromonas sp.]|nr:cobyrinic acid ac-diamide synthase [Polaromonas sp.]